MGQALQQVVQVGEGIHFVPMCAGPNSDRIFCQIKAVWILVW